MTDLEKIKYTKSFVDKLAKGVNPNNNSKIPESDVIYDEHVSGCMRYVSSILQKIIDNDGSIGYVSKPKKELFNITEKQLANFAFSDIPLNIKELTNNINSLIDLDKIKRVSQSKLLEWLVELGMLKIVESISGQRIKTVTNEGKFIGIITEQRKNAYGSREVILYTREAQEFVIENINDLVEFVRENTEKAEKQYDFWTDTDDKKLRDMYSSGSSVAEMAKVLQRTNRGVRARLKKLGLIEARSDAK